TAGSRSAIKTAMIAITTRSSIRVKPRRTDGYPISPSGLREEKVHANFGEGPTREMRIAGRAGHRFRKNGPMFRSEQALAQQDQGDPGNGPAHEQAHGRAVGPAPDGVVRAGALRWAVDPAQHQGGRDGKESDQRGVVERRAVQLDGDDEDGQD